MGFENLNWTTDRLWSPTVDHADDVIILENTKEDVKYMLLKLLKYDSKMTWRKISGS